MKKEKLNNQRAFSITQAAQYACVSRGTVESWINTDQLAFEQLPGRGKGSHRFIRIRKIELDNFLNKFHSPRVGTRKITKRSNIILEPK